MKTLIVLLLLALPALAHITDEERPWIIGIQDAAQKIEQENKVLAGLLETAGEKRAAAEQSVGRYQTLYGQLQAEHVTAQKAVEDLADAKEAERARADAAEESVLKLKNRILWLGISTTTLGLGCIALAYLLFKP